jgi:hypothetical protein
MRFMFVSLLAALIAGLADHRQTAADAQDLSGDIAGAVAGEEYDGVGDFGRLSEAPKRNRFLECFEMLLGDREQ